MLIRWRGQFLTYSPFSLKSSTPAHVLRRGCFTMSSSVEHLVLFKIKHHIDSGKLPGMIDSLNGLTSLDQVLHLTAGPLHKNRSISALGGFTHMLHSRYRSKEDLATYSAHPAHVAVVKDKVLPICDDIMAVDWLADGASISPGPGSALRITLLKLKEDSDRDEVLGILRGVTGCLDKVVQSSVGVNFSPVRAKGFTLASLVVYGGLEDLEEANNSNGDVHKEKVRPYVDGLVDVEYVIPSSSSQQSANL